MTEQEEGSFLEDCEIATALANAEKTQHEAEFARWNAASAKLAYEAELINHQHQLDGVYTFNRVVTEKSTNRLLRAMKMWHDHDPEGKWTIYLNSVGGEIVSGNALLDELYTHSLRGGGSHHITIKVRGAAASMAGVLLQAADLRLMGPTALLMIHEPSSGASGTLHDIRAESEWLERWWVTASELYAARATGMTAAEIRAAAYKQDWWLTAEQAVTEGFADQIG